MQMRTGRSSVNVMFGKMRTRDWCVCWRAMIAYRHGVVIRIFPKGQIKETRSIVVAISQSASSFNFSLTVFESNSQLISTPRGNGQLLLLLLLTQSTSVVNRFDSFIFHALHQLCGCEFFDQIRRYDETSIVIAAPRHRDTVDDGRR